MPDLRFSIDRAEAVAHAAAPLLNFSLRIIDHASVPDRVIHTVALRCQIRIEPAKRKYGPHEKERLADLFGDVPRWGQTLKSMLWTHASVMAPPFEGETVVELPVPCTYDFNLAAAKYFHALEDGEVPLTLMFSGTVFYANLGQPLQVAQIPWDREAAFKLPVRVWREMMDLYYPNAIFFSLHKDTFDRLYQYKSDRSLATWESAIDELLSAVAEKATR